MDAAPGVTPGPVPPVPTPSLPAYGGTPAKIPGVIQAAEFDYGGQGVAYYDTDAANIGGVS